MGSQAARLTGNCRTCGAAGVGWAVQLTRDDRLHWELDWECTSCGTASCDQGNGILASELRQELLEQHGSHRLRLGEGDFHGGAILRVFRQVFACDLREAQEHAGRLRDAGFAGTSVEVELLADLLRRQGIPVDLGLPGADTLLSPDERGSRT